MTYHELIIHSDEEGHVDINPQTHEVVVEDLPDGNVRYYFRRVRSGTENGNDRT